MSLVCLSLDYKQSLPLSKFLLVHHAEFHLVCSPCVSSNSLPKSPVALAITRVLAVPSVAHQSHSFQCPRSLRYSRPPRCLKGFFDESNPHIFHLSPLVLKKPKNFSKYCDYHGNLTASKLQELVCWPHVSLLHCNQ